MLTKYQKILSILFSICIFSCGFYSASAFSANSNFLVITDIHLAKQKRQPMDMKPNIRTDDNDLDLFNFIKQMLEINWAIHDGRLANPDFILILGDIAGHIRYSADSVVDEETLVFAVLKNYFPNTPILYTFGNNDSSMSNYGPFIDEERRDSYKSPFDVATLKSGWTNGFLSTGIKCKETPNTYPCLIHEDKTNGYYSAYLKPGLRYISLNSVIFAYKRLFVSKKDAEKELTWLHDQLKEAESFNESTLIGMHIPPGNKISNGTEFWLPEIEAEFLHLIKAHKKTVIGLLASHTHMDELKVIRDQENRIITGVYVTAALSTSRGNAPSVKSFNLSDDFGNWQLTNYTSYNFLSNQMILVLHKLYDFHDEYCSSADQKTLMDCLDNVTIDKMKEFYTAGNPRFNEIIDYPTNMNINIDSFSKPIE